MHRLASTQPMEWHMLAHESLVAAVDADDQIGSLNEISPAASVAAACLVRHGKVFDPGRILDSGVSHFPGRPVGNRRWSRMRT